MLDKMERKFGKYAIPGLIKYLIGGYVVGYLMMMLSPNMVSFLTLEPYMIFHKFQIWRILTWVIIPPGSLGIFTIIMLIFYWSLGNNLEQMWGSFRFNLYIFGGIFFTVIGSFLVYFIVMSVEAINPAWGIGIARDAITGIIYPSMGAFFSTYYINLSIFLAFAMTIPDMQVLLYFFIPVKMKWLAILYAAIVGVDFFNGNTITRIAILCSLFNFLIFFLSTRNFKSFKSRNYGTNRRGFTYRTYDRSGRQKTQGGNEDRGFNPYGAAQQARQNTNNTGWSASNNRSNTSGISRHHCSICGKTEITHPGIEFRFCSKCNGNYEYCNEHLFTHEHVQ